MPGIQDFPLSKTTRRGRARAERLAKRTSTTGSDAIRAGMPGGAYRPLYDTDMTKVASAALNILEQVGVGDVTCELLDIVLPNGCWLNRHGRVCFPVALMEDIIAGTASS